MSTWKDIDCSSCGNTSHARTTAEPLAYCPHCRSSAVDVFSGVYEGETVDMFDCEHCSRVFNVSTSPTPGYCPLCGSERIGQFP